jgi:hypothetical protein
MRPKIQTKKCACTGRSLPQRSEPWLGFVRLAVSPVSLLTGVEPVEVDELNVAAVMRGGEEGSIESAG